MPPSICCRWYSVYNKEADSTEAVRNVPWEQWENMLRANAGLPNVCEEREKKIREWWEILEAVVLDINADTAPKQEDYSQRLDSLLASAPPGMTSREVQHLKRIVECLPHSAALSAAVRRQHFTCCCGHAAAEPISVCTCAGRHLDPDWLRACDASGAGRSTHGPRGASSQPLASPPLRSNDASLREPAAVPALPAPGTPQHSDSIEAGSSRSA